MALRILVVDDAQQVVEAIIAQLAPHADLAVVATASGGHQALRILATHDVDVVLLDLNMPRLNGLETLALIRQLHADVRVLVVTSHAEMAWVVPALRAGAAGYVLKTAPPHELANAIRASAGDGRPVTPEIIDALVASHQQPQRRTDLHLSPREQDTLRLLAEGLTSEAIAAEQCLSVSAVKKALASINIKLGTQNRTQAVAEGARLGLIAITPHG